MLNNSDSLMSASPLHLASRTKCNASLFLLSHQSAALLIHNHDSVEHLHLQLCICDPEVLSGKLEELPPGASTKTFDLKMFDRIVIV